MEIRYYSHPICLEHQPGSNHPERPERLGAIEKGLEKAGLMAQFDRVEPDPISEEFLDLVHTDSHVEKVLDARGKALQFDGDTRTSPASIDAAKVAAGGAKSSVDWVLENREFTTFCSLRPPGHHAESNRAMGFCFFNNAALAAAYALDYKNLKRVAIIDPDVHHGNGTQEIFYSSHHVLYISTHQFPFYPGTGNVNEIGEASGQGYTANFPLPAGQGDGDFHFLTQGIIRDLLFNYKPELLIFSAGFDAHQKDPLAGMEITSQGFVHLYAPLLEFAWEESIPFFFVLEGGYSLEALEQTIPLLLEAVLHEDLPSAQSLSSPQKPAREVAGKIRGSLL